MYHWVTDKEYLKRAYSECSDIVNQLVQNLSNYGIKAKMNVVGSKSRNMITQYEKEPIDFDFNVTILSANNINDCRTIKENARKAFNEVLNANGWSDCEDSTSSLTTERRHFTKGNKTEFSIDVCLVRMKDDSWYRLIHKKTGYSYMDSYMWEMGPNSKAMDDKVKYLKENTDAWIKVREAYLEKKNMYLTRNDYNHSSFICYIEAVNEIYYQYKGTYINRNFNIIRY